MGLLSPEMYADSSMVKANVNNFGLSRSDLSVEEFKEQSIEENGLFVLTSSTADDEGVEHQEVRYFQDARGQLPLSPVDTDARWRTTRSGKPSGLNYQENVVVDLGGFIVARGVSHASEGEWKALPELLEKLPLRPVSLAADTAYSVGQLRELLEGKGITAYIPIHPNQESSMVSKGDFIYRGDHLICPQGKVLRRSALQRRDRAYQYVAHQKDCQSCPVKARCLPPNQKRRYVALSMYHPLLLQAQELKKTAAYRRERKRRQTIAEGTFTSLDRLGWAQSRLRGLWKVDCEGYMAALAHNVLKLVRTLSRSVGPPGPALPAPAGNAELRSTREDAVSGPPIPPKYGLRHIRLTKGPVLRIRRPHCRRR